MDSLKLVDAGLRAFDARLPEVSPARCLVTRYRASACRRCLDVCPTGAIAPEGWLTVDPDRCTSCGACAAVCRTGALSFDGRSLVLREYLHTAGQQHQRHARIICHRSGSPGPLADYCAGEVKVRCLGGISAADLIGAAANGMKRLELQSGLCETCLDRAAGMAVEAAIRTAEHVLGTLGVEIAFERSRKESPPGEGSAPENNPAGQTDGVSRRELFSFLARGLQRTVGNSTTAPRRGVAELHAQTPPPHAHERLVCDLVDLAGEMCKWPVALSTGLPLGRITIGDLCNGCGLCVKYCPHGCFRPEDDSIVVEDNRCTGCGLCAEVCPPEALIVKPGELVQ